MGTITPEQQQQVDALLFGGKKIEAIKLYREWTQAGLKEAKDAVDGREAELRTQSPQSFSRQPPGCFSMILLPVAVMAAVTFVVYLAP